MHATNCADDTVSNACISPATLIDIQADKTTVNNRARQTVYKQSHYRNEKAGLNRAAFYSRFLIYSPIPNKERRNKSCFQGSSLSRQAKIIPDIDFRPISY